jgi:hypothetical protein
MTATLIDIDMASIPFLATLATNEYGERVKGSIRVVQVSRRQWRCRSGFKNH